VSLTTGSRHYSPAAKRPHFRFGRPCSARDRMRAAKCR